MIDTPVIGLPRQVITPENPWPGLYFEQQTTTTSGSGYSYGVGAISASAISGAPVSGYAPLIKYALSADVGTFTYAGQAAALLYVKYRLPADVGIFTYTGQDAPLSVQRRIAADVGVFTYTGQDAALHYNRRITLDTGIFTYSGQILRLATSKGISVGRVPAGTMCVSDKVPTSRVPAGTVCSTVTPIPRGTAIVCADAVEIPRIVAPPTAPPPPPSPQCIAPTGWTEVTPMPAARGQTYGAVIGDYFFVFGGSTDYAETVISNSVYRYNRLTNTWDAPTVIPYLARELVAQLLPNGKMLIAGGRNSSGFTNTAYWYDPYANTWTQKSNLPFTWIDGRSGVLPDGRIIICGGSKNNSTTRITDTYVYDPALDTYTLTNPLHFPVGNNVTATLSDGRIISTAGVTNPGDGYSTHTELFDPATMSWTVVSPCPENLGNYSGIVATPCGQVYVWGGSPPGPPYPGRKLVYEYLPATDTWTKLPDLPFFAGWGAYGQFSNGQYIWAGGHDDTDMTAKTYLSVAPP